MFSVQLHLVLPYDQGGVLSPARRLVELRASSSVCVLTTCGARAEAKTGGSLRAPQAATFVP